MGFEDSLFSLPLVTQVAWQDFGKQIRKKQNTHKKTEGKRKGPLEVVNVAVSLRSVPIWKWAELMLETPPHNESTSHDRCKSTYEVSF